MIGQAHGSVLEVGVGGGQHFSFLRFNPCGTCGGSRGRQGYGGNSSSPPAIPITITTTSTVPWPRSSSVRWRIPSAACVKSGASSSREVLCCYLNMCMHKDVSLPGAGCPGSRDDSLHGLWSLEPEYVANRSLRGFPDDASASDQQEAPAHAASPREASLNAGGKASLRGRPSCVAFKRRCHTRED
jgi:hypothetical protein